MSEASNSRPPPANDKLDTPVKVITMLTIQLIAHLKIILKVFGTMLFPQIIMLMSKNMVILLLSVAVVGLACACNHLTHRLDDAINYINAFEETYPDYLDTVAEGDAYSEWYQLWD